MKSWFSYCVNPLATNRCIQLKFSLIFFARPSIHLAGLQNELMARAHETVVSLWILGWSLVACKASIA
jgi:hypothetical protein